MSELEIILSIIGAALVFSIWRISKLIKSNNVLKAEIRNHQRLGSYHTTNRQDVLHWPYESIENDLYGPGLDGRSSWWPTAKLASEARDIANLAYKKGEESK